MALASGLVEVTTPRPLDDWPGSRRERPDALSTFLSFADSGWRSMGALALAVAALHPDAELAARISHAVDPAVVATGPPWLTSMSAIEITSTWLQAEVLGDGENVIVVWQWPDGSSATAFVYVDHNLGTLVKDAFVVPDDGAQLLTVLAGPEQPTVVALEPAVARARITEAIDAGERTVPPLETESWPSCRPMVEWVLGRLPEGGTGYERPDWSHHERERLLDEFQASPRAAIAGLDAEQVRALADPLVRFACDYGPGDPLRWSPVSVEIALADWYPRKVFGFPVSELERLPEVLGGFVRFCHQRTSVPRELTHETIESIERWRPDFLRSVGRLGRNPAANAARLARFAGGLDPGGFDNDDDRWIDSELAGEDFLAEVVEEVEADLVELVGGPDAYDAVTDAPLGDVAFDWSAIPDALEEPVDETLTQLDGWASALFDDEVRTIARAVLAGVVTTDQAVFNRSARTDALAAAILAYLMSRLTGRMSKRERRTMPWSVFTQKELAAATGVPASSISSRSRTVANVVERADIAWPALLHSTQRREVLEVKQRVAAWRSGNGDDE